MAKTPRGRVERIVTSRAKWTQQRTRAGTLVYRKDGKFTTQAAYERARKRSGADIEVQAFDRAGRFGQFTKRTRWIREGNRAGDFAKDVIPGVRAGQKLTEAQRRILMREVRYVHGFEAFWLDRGEKLSRAEAMREFDRMISQLRKAGSAAQRERIRVKFGLAGGSGFDAKRARRGSKSRRPKRRKK